MPPNKVGHLFSMQVFRQFNSIRFVQFMDGAAAYGHVKWYFLLFISKDEKVALERIQRRFASKVCAGQTT